MRSEHPVTLKVLAQRYTRSSATDKSLFPRFGAQPLTRMPARVVALAATNERSEFLQGFGTDLRKEIDVVLPPTMTNCEPASAFLLLLVEASAAVAPYRSR